MRVAGLFTGCVLPLMMLGVSCHANDPVRQVGFYKLDSQRISGATSVSSPSVGGVALEVVVTVDTTGNVIAAKPVNNYARLDPSPGLAAVRQWKFHPQSFDGKPVVAVGKVSISYQVPELSADPTVKFPSFDGAHVEITLDRSACFGSCPDYRVTVSGDGMVRFSVNESRFANTIAAVHRAYNRNGVLLTGTHIAHIDAVAVTKLFDQFRAAHFFGLKNEYVAQVTDNPTYRLTVRIGDSQKTVVDYVGGWVGMPHEVTELENAVDAAAGTARWIEGNRDTLVDLESHGFDFHSKAGGELAVAAASRMTLYDPPAHIDELLLGLINRGVSLDIRNGDLTLGQTLVIGAAKSGNEALFTQMVQRGQLAAMPHEALNQAFRNVGCSPMIARSLVKAGADPRHVGEESALNALTGELPICGDDEERMIEMAKALIDLGVPVEARNDLGWTALMGCDSPRLAQLLLDHGASPNAHGKDGLSAVLSTDDDRVALILLRAGADPHARDEQGSLRKQAVQRNMPATLAWLDAHGIR